MRALARLSSPLCGITLGAIVAAFASTAALAQTAPPLVAAGPQAAPVQREVALTEQQIEHVLASQKDFDAIAETMPATEAAQSDPKYTTQFEAAAKKHGFASYAEYNAVVETISVVLGGFDPVSKKYIGLGAVIRQQIAAVQADAQMSAKDKQTVLDEMNALLKAPLPPAPMQANIDLVGKHYDQLAAAMQDE